jgi:hypothetical protein
LRALSPQSTISGVSEDLIDREEINALMWNVADTLTLVRDLHSLFFEADDEEEEEGDA